MAFDLNHNYWQLQVPSLQSHGVPMITSVDFIMAKAVSPALRSKSAMASFEIIAEIIFPLPRSSITFEVINPSSTLMILPFNWFLALSFMGIYISSVSYTHLRAHETRHDL